jgi:outer membrane lipoprotein-sorting protein
MKEIDMRAPTPRASIPAIAILFIALSAAAFAQSPTGAEILAAVDRNAAFSSASYRARLEVSKGKRTNIKTMKALATQDGKSLVEFTNPEDAGIKYLKLKDELWAYFPEENDTVKISGHQLKEGFMGSDLSYEDTLDLDELSGKYETALRGIEDMEGRKAYVVDLSAVAKDAPYDLRSLWVDAERWIILKEEMKSKSGTLIKTSRALEVKSAQGRWYVAVLEMKDMRKKDSLTVFRIDSISYGVKIDPKAFWLESLSK